jgi:hypothetical protein
MSDTPTLFGINTNNVLKKYFESIIEEKRTFFSILRRTAVDGLTKSDENDAITYMETLTPSAVNITNENINVLLTKVKKYLYKLIQKKNHPTGSGIYIHRFNVKHLKFYTFLYTILHIYVNNDFIKSAKDLIDDKVNNSSNQSPDNKYKKFLHYINFMNDDMRNILINSAFEECKKNKRNKCSKEMFEGKYKRYKECLDSVKYNAAFEQLNNLFVIDVILLKKVEPEFFEIFESVVNHFKQKKIVTVKDNIFNNKFFMVDKSKTILFLFSEILKLNWGGFSNDKWLGDKLIKLILSKYLYIEGQMAYESEINERMEKVHDHITLPEYLQSLFYEIITSNDINKYFTNETINDTIYNDVERNPTIVKGLLDNKLLKYNSKENEAKNSASEFKPKVSLIRHIVNVNLQEHPADYLLAIDDINVLLLYVNLYTIISIYYCFLCKTEEDKFNNLKIFFNNVVKLDYYNDDTIMSGGSDRPKKLNVNAKFIKKSYKKNKNASNKRKFKNKSKKYKA